MHTGIWSRIVERRAGYDNVTVLPSDHKTVSSRALAVDGSSARSQHCLRAPRTTTLKTGICGWIAAKIFGHASRQVSTNFRITPAVSCDNHQRYFLSKTRITGSGSPTTAFGYRSTDRRKKSSQKRCVPGGQRMQIFSGSDWTQLRLRAGGRRLVGKGKPTNPASESVS